MPDVRQQNGSDGQSHMTPKLALVGDYDSTSKPHQAIPRGLALASDLMIRCDFQWIHSTTLTGAPRDQLGSFDGIWCVPGSPYANQRGVLDAIRFARETGKAFLGTCGGFQHALLEYAEAMWGMSPHGDELIISPLACVLDEQPRQIWLEAGSRLSSIYGVDIATEDYHCSYGVNPAHSGRFDNAPLRVGARDADGSIRAIELDNHPFFFAALFQPERSAFRNVAHPLIRTFLEALMGNQLPNQRLQPAAGGAVMSRRG